MLIKLAVGVSPTPLSMAFVNSVCMTARLSFASPAFCRMARGGKSS
jgi:hypothetical protein